jgi:hypothetical protein
LGIPFDGSSVFVLGLGNSIFEIQAMMQGSKNVAEV